MQTMTSSSDFFKKAELLISQGQKLQALEYLRTFFTPDTNFAEVVQAMQWAKKTDWSELRSVKIAFLGGGTLSNIVDFIKFWFLLEGFDLKEFIPSYNTWKMEVLNPASALYKFKPDMVWFFTHWRDFSFEPALDADVNQAEGMAAKAIDELRSYWTVIKKELPGAQIIQNNADPVPERVFGHFDSSLPGSLTNLIRRFNLQLPISALESGAMVFDLEYLAGYYGLKAWHDYVYWFHSKQPFTPRLAVGVAYQATCFFKALKGSAKKVIVLDLDNTLWGGVIGDDGLEGIVLNANNPTGEAFLAFQSYLKNLAQRGIVLTVASKNEEAAAKLPFQQHPEMRLTVDDIAVFKANWKNKADNIRETAEILNLGLDSFVFLDDNPAERALVKNELPMVAVPELPSDPALYISTLTSMSLFENASYSIEDKIRGRMYRENAQRKEVQIQVTNLAEYLVNLDMRGKCGFAEAMHIPRMSQLVNKSNQFHLTTTRYTEEELRCLTQSDQHIVRWFSLKDRFGDYGLIAVLIMKRENQSFTIDTWAMSCRVLERNMEEFIVRDLIKLASDAGAQVLVGRYIPSKKNALVANLYDRLGFNPHQGEQDVYSWSLSLPAARDKYPIFIKNDNFEVTYDK